MLMEISADIIKPRMADFKMVGVGEGPICGLSRLWWIWDDRVRGLRFRKVRGASLSIHSVAEDAGMPSSA